MGAFVGLPICLCGDPCKICCLWSEFEFYESDPRTRLMSNLSCGDSLGVWKLSSPFLADSPRVTLLLADLLERGDIGGLRFSLYCWLN